MKLVIDKCGSLKSNELLVKKFNLLFGYKGKSLIAKNLLYFLNMEDLFTTARVKGIATLDELKSYLAYHYLYCFSHESIDSSICFNYNDIDYIKIKSHNSIVNVELSDSLFDKFKRTSISDFSIPYEVIYVPSERDIVYYLTRSDYLEDNVISDYCHYYNNTVIKNFINNGIVYDDDVLNFVNKILDRPYNVTSQGCGWQECLGNLSVTHLSTSTRKSLALINTLIHQLNFSRRSSFVIIEEPESDQYPLLQMYLTQLLILFVNRNNSVVITTNSPYVLGTISNSTYASFIKNKDKLSKIIAEYLVLDAKNVSSYYIDSSGNFQNGLAEDGLICNELMDDASDVINSLSDELIYCDD